VRSLKAVALAVAGLVASVAGGSPGAAWAASANKVAIVTASPRSDSAARYLATQIDLPTVRRASDNARQPDLLVKEARAKWQEDLVVVVDSERATVSVVRPSDGTISSRTLSAEAAAAPYAMALAAVELLEIVRNAPPAHTAPERARPPRGVIVHLAIDAGIIQSVGISGNLGLLEPTIGVDVGFSRDKSPVWLLVGLHASGLVPLERDLTLIVPMIGPTRGSIEYRRDEVSVRFGIGHRQGPSAVFGWADLGLAFIRLDAWDSQGISTATDERTAIWLGLGAELRYTVVGGFALGIGAGVAFLPVPSRFYASPQGSTTELTALREDGVELRARASLIWEFDP
jgi:hypothetical protein